MACYFEFVLLLISIFGSLDSDQIGGYQLGYELLPINGLLTFWDWY